MLSTLLLGLVVVVAVVAGLLLLEGGESAPPQVVWPGPVRDGPMQVRDLALDAGGSAEWPDGGDVSLDWLDITHVRARPADQAHWSIGLAGPPPRADTLDAAETVISYGLVFDTTNDGRADYVVGINNDAPVQGEFRTWVTDLATGATEEQIGPPYGFPVEFSHPDEQVGHGNEPLAPPFVMFTFLGARRPHGLTGQSPFYAWSAVTQPGGTVAWDYAPDNSWMVLGTE